MPNEALSLTVLTQNAFGGGPRWDLRRKILARRIAQVRPDIIGLQEVHADAPGAPSQAHELADLVGGYHVDFAPARVEDNGHSEGVALLCRTGIRERSVEALTLDQDDFWDRAGQRVVLCASLEVGAVRVDAFVTHLSLSRKARARTIPEMMLFAARERRRSGATSAVLMGDFNALPNEPSIGQLESCDGAMGGPWVDAWKLANGERARGATWPAIAPFRRIDYIFVQGDAEWIVLGCDVEPVAGSDHRGLLARLQPTVPVQPGAQEVRE